MHVVCMPLPATSSAARLPDGWHLRWSPAARSRSSRPASARLPNAVAAPGRLAFSLRRAPRRSRAARARSATAAVRPQCRRPARPRARSVAASSSRGCSSSRSAPLMVTDSRPGNANSHSTVPLTTPIIGGSLPAASRRKCALTMARNSVGAVRSGTSDAADQRRHREDHARRRARARTLSLAEIERRDPVALRSASARSRCSNRTVPPLRCRESASAGSIKRWRQALARDQRTAGLRRPQQRLADDARRRAAPSLPADRC